MFYLDLLMFDVTLAGSSTWALPPHLAWARSPALRLRTPRDQLMLLFCQQKIFFESSRCFLNFYNLRKKWRVS